MKSEKIPEATILRLSVYSRYLNQLINKGIITVSSDQIADGVNGSPAQVRKDLAYFGEFGVRGVGYNVKDLYKQVTKILGLDSTWNVVIVGAGNLGTALSQYKGFVERGFNTLAMFDIDKGKIGTRIGEVPVLSLEDMEEFIRKNNVAIGIVTVSARAAQEVTDLLVKAGIKAVLNFAPVALSVPQHVEFRNVDLAVYMDLLTFNMVNNKQLQD